MKINKTNPEHGSLTLKNSILYAFAEVTNSELGDYNIIGDFSRIRESILGSYVRIDRNNFISESIIGDYSYTGPFDMVFRCKIGKYTSISYGVTIGPPEHDYHLLTTHPFIYSAYYPHLSKEDLVTNNKLERECDIGNDVWIGCNVTILRNVKIGSGAIVGANSLVNKDVPPYAIVAGVPAKIIKYRFSSNIIEELLKLEWWNWETEKIKLNKNIFKEPLTIEKLKEIR